MAINVDFQRLICVEGQQQNRTIIVALCCLQHDHRATWATNTQV
jgi:hypothetical protein